MMDILKKNLINMKIAFWGTPDIARDTLQILKDNGYLPNIVITSPDKPSGRGLSLHETQVSNWARENNISLLKPEKLDEKFISEFEKLNIDLSIVVAYGKILPEKLIKTPRLGTINIHYSLLPRWRGASPLESALLNGDLKTGVSIQQMEFKLDSGPLLAEKEISIDIKDTKETLKEKLVKEGGNLLCSILPKIEHIEKKPQDESQATYCKKINKEDGEINLESNSKENYNKYRAYYGWPGTFFYTQKRDKKLRVKIKEASYENDSFVIKRVTPEGKKEVTYDDFLRQN